MNKRQFKMECILLCRIIINIIFYVSNIIVYNQIKFHSNGTKIPIKNAVLFYIFGGLEFLAFIITLESLFKDIDPLNFKYVKKYRVIFFTYLITLFSDFFSLKITIKGVNLIIANVIIWAVMFILVFLLQKSIYENYLEIDLNSFLKLEENYIKNDIEENEKDTIKNFKKFSFGVLIITVFSVIIYENIMDNVLFFVFYLILYTLILLKLIINTFKFKKKKQTIIFSLLNSFFASIGCLMVWLLYNNYIKFNFLNNRSLDELYVIQVLFLMPIYFYGLKIYMKFNKNNYLN